MLPVHPPIAAAPRSAPHESNLAQLRVAVIRHMVRHEMGGREGRQP